MFRILAIAAGVVNTCCMFLAQVTADQPVFMVAWFGAGFSFYGYLFFTDEATQRGQTPMGYQNLAMRLRWDITEQGLTPGQRLPSVAELARSHDTTRTTVMRALRILAEEGIVEVVHGRGTYIVGQRADRPKDRIEAHLLEKVSQAQPGDAMPSTGELMHLHDASHVTVRRVQAALAQRGLLKRTSSGAYVKP